MACENQTNFQMESECRPELKSARLSARKIPENPGLSHGFGCAVPARLCEAPGLEENAPFQAGKGPRRSPSLARSCGTLGEQSGPEPAKNRPSIGPCCPLLPGSARNRVSNRLQCQSCATLTRYKARLSSSHHQKETQRRGRRCMRRSRRSVASAAFRRQSAMTAARNWRCASVPAITPWGCSRRWLLAPSSAWRSRRQSGRPSLR